MIIFFKFCLVGIVGFIVDLGLLLLIISYLTPNPYIARIFSFLFAAISTWFLNRSYTFKDSKQASSNELFIYITLMSFGALINYSTYAIFLALILKSNNYLWLAVAVGSVTSMGVNFLTSKFLLSQH